MILTCPKCATRLKLEAAALPDSTFNVLCPKCQTLISVVPSMVTPRAGHAPQAGFNESFPAPAAATLPSSIEKSMEALPQTASTGQPQDQLSALASLLVAVLNKSASLSGSCKPSVSSEDFLRRRNVLICLGHPEDVAQAQAALKNHEYELLPIDSAEQALEMLQLSNKIDVVLLSPDFQVDNQGSAAMLRFISSLSPDRRRRLFLALVTSNCRTADARLAFNQGVNLVIHSAELHMLPLALAKSIRDFNYLYRSFNEASSSMPF
jgi:predicted Zn finger-like uncharacterized protein